MPSPGGSAKTEARIIGDELVAAIGVLEKKDRASYTMSASGQVFADSRRAIRASVRASSSGVGKFRSGGVAGTVIWGEVAGGALTAGQEIVFDEELCASGLYYEQVSGTATVRVTAEPSA